MELFGRDRGRLKTDQDQATGHHVRVRIMELFTRNKLRPMQCDALSADLLTEFPDLRDEAKPAQVNYHLAVLRDAQLLPTGG